MSSMCRLGRFWAPPKIVILRLFTARFVRMFTVRSSRCRGEYPQMVAGRIVTVVKSSPWYRNRMGSHIPLYLL